MMLEANADNMDFEFFLNKNCSYTQFDVVFFV